MKTLYERILDDSTRLVKIAGNSDETPPTAGIATGSQFAVTDGGEIKMYDEIKGWSTFAKFDTGAAASVGSGLGGGFGGGGVYTGGNDEPEEPEEPTEPAEGGGE